MQAASHSAIFRTIPASAEYAGTGKNTSDGKTSLSITRTCGIGKEHQAGRKTTYAHPNAPAWYLPVLRIHRIFLESGESRIKKLSLLGENPPPGVVGAVYSSVAAETGSYSLTEWENLFPDNPHQAARL